MVTWRGLPPPPPERIGPGGWLLVALRGPVLLAVIGGGLALLLVLRLPERLAFGAARPVTARIPRAISRVTLAVMGITLVRRGRPMRGPGAIVANHAGWLDILTLNACDRVAFVAKAEVAGWPGIGWLARASGTVFIRRDPGRAVEQTAQIAARLAAGHRLAIFPEATSTDGRRVLPFKTTLFAAFFAAGDAGAAGLAVQPVTVAYHPPPGAPPEFYGWWDDMDFAPHFLKVLARRRQGLAEVTFHAPIPVAAAGNRKELARRAEAAVRAGFPFTAPEERPELPHPRQD